jgi:hypothetical protein
MFEQLSSRFAQRSGYSYFGEACKAAWYSGFL